jgi:hypothetical protein
MGMARADGHVDSAYSCTSELAVIDSGIRLTWEFRSRQRHSRAVTGRAADERGDWRLASPVGHRAPKAKLVIASPHTYFHLQQEIQQVA